MTDPTAANEPDFQVNSAEINALLQARGTGKVGAILVENGVSTKNGGKSLHMLRELAARGLLVERPAEDEDQKTIVYFDLARRANLGFLDLAASQAINELAKANLEVGRLNREISESIDETTKSLEVLASILAQFEASMSKVRGAVGEAEKGCLEMSAAGGPDADAWLKMAEASRILGAEIDGMMS